MLIQCVFLDTKSAAVASTHFAVKQEQHTVHAILQLHVISKQATQHVCVSLKQVAWVESWWEASDWSGLRELGADKSGSTPEGAFGLHSMHVCLYK